MGKRIKRIVDDVVARWKDTITGITPIDTDKAKKLLLSRNRKMRIFSVNTPMEFYIGQAIIRGRLSKIDAKQICSEFRINDAFVSDMSKCGGFREMFTGNRWYRNAVTSILNSTVQDYTLRELDTTKKLRNRWRNRTSIENKMAFALNNLQELYSLFFPYDWDPHNDRKRTESEKARMSIIGATLGFRGRQSERSQGCLHEAISGHVDDLLAGEFDPNEHWFDAVHTEIIMTAIGKGKKAQNVEANYELFHCVPAVAMFRDAALILTSRPIIHEDADGNLHNTAGSAVEYADGYKFWFIDGHMLNTMGEKIVMAPDTLTPKNIQEIPNEEVRRIAIDRYGWGKYLQDGGGKILDYRENWVDNTVEVLIKPPRVKEHWQANPLRMVLACRSTGRKYFIAVPADPINTRANLDDDDFDLEETKEGRVKIRRCETAQQWMANGATVAHLPYATKELNIIGAS